MLGAPAGDENHPCCFKRSLSSRIASPGITERLSYFTRLSSLVAGTANANCTLPWKGLTLCKPRCTGLGLAGIAASTLAAERAIVERCWDLAEQHLAEAAPLKAVLCLPTACLLPQHTTNSKHVLAVTEGRADDNSQEAEVSLSQVPPQPNVLVAVAEGCR